MTTRLPLFPPSQKGGSDSVANRRSRLLIVCPLADIYSGVG